MPVRFTTFVPSPSSVTTMSATLIRVVVSAASARLVTAFCNATAVGAVLPVTVIGIAFSKKLPTASVTRTRTQ